MNKLIILEMEVTQAFQKKFMVNVKVIEYKCRRLRNYIWVSCGAVKWELLSCYKMFLAIELWPIFFLHKQHLLLSPRFSLSTGNISVKALYYN